MASSLVARHCAVLRLQRAKAAAFRGNPKDQDKEVRGEVKQFLVKVQARNQAFKVVKLPHTPHDREMGRAWSDKLWELQREFQLEFGYKALLRMEALDALPAELRAHAFEVTDDQPSGDLHILPTPWPHWLEEAANE